MFYVGPDRIQVYSLPHFRPRRDKTDLDELFLYGPTNPRKGKHQNTVKKKENRFYTQRLFQNDVRLEMEP